MQDINYVDYSYNRNIYTFTIGITLGMLCV